MTTVKNAWMSAIFMAGLMSAGAVMAHGNVTPTAVNTGNLEKLGEEWRTENPYRTGKDHDEAQSIGASAYNQNCAACHGLEAKSGGIAPDLRMLDAGALGDEWFVERVRRIGARWSCLHAEDGGLPEPGSALGDPYLSGQRACRGVMPWAGCRCC